MKKIVLILALAGVELSAQTIDYKKAPNSYIYDMALAQSNNYGGLYIPVKKAYEMWANYAYLKTNGISIPIPAGAQSASLYWEDNPGLVSNVEIEAGATPDLSRIKVNIRKAKKSGNAVIAFKVNGQIYWSWHVWVTDDPSNGVAYAQDFETDVNGQPFSVQYMDRNLGATAASFLGNDWQKSGGLLYQWGRKDPFPSLVYKDNDFYEISGEVGTLRHKQIDATNTIAVKQREFNEIEKNIQDAVKNPLTYIINTDATGNWFSNSRYKVAGTSPNYTNWDLWSDNAKGGNSNANSSSTTLKSESRSYELKSELDPCPNGWRVPSYYGRETQNNNLAFFGRKDWNNSDSNVATRQLFPDSQNAQLSGVKVYPGLGVDFEEADNGGRNLGNVPIAGTYVYYPNSVAPNAPVGITYQDQGAVTGIWSATYGYDGARLFSLISDPLRTNTLVGLHALYNNQTNPTKAGNSVRCMRDPNLSKIGNFTTAYVTESRENYTKGLQNPNSYLSTDGSAIIIPVSKAFAVHNQYLSEQGMLDSDALVSKVLWTTNPNLVQSIQIVPTSYDPRDSNIVVQLNPNEKGNAVVSLHNNDTTSSAYWSWLIWAPEENPSSVSYLTEANLNAQYNFVNPTKSTLPPLATTFMDRNLGAIKSMPSQLDAATADLAQGLHYQWGRKDPIPAFNQRGAGTQTIYIGSENSSANGILNYTAINAAEYENTMAVPYANYALNFGTSFEKTKTSILFSVQNPMKYMYQTGVGTLYNGGNHYSNDLNQVRDWVSSDRGQAQERWGHGTTKSVYDPCPLGWRVPDTSFTNLYSGSKGNSPWYNGYVNDATGKQGIIQDQWYDVAGSYLGSNVGGRGWSFQNSLYKIGNFANDGIRGELGGKSISMDRSGVWTSSMADMRTGYALAMQFQNNNNKMQTATGVYPQAAMGVRCAKDENRLLGVPVANIPVSNPGGTLGTNETVSDRDGVQVYPNPFHSEINVNNKQFRTFEMFDASGKMVLSGDLKDGKIYAAHLQNGIYILKLMTNNGTIEVKKVIKN
ncbi:MAG: T9SS type A sorting domain-containing protein [Bacteroidetes bacterium]|nr:T9SS type A sorting domain-containing protein [Bacteroidota bacterium]